VRKIEIITLSQKNISDFASARNLLLSKAKSNWVFFVDSDEQISPAEPDLAMLDTDFAGYKILRKNYFLGDYVGSEYLTRLAKKEAGEWVRRVHETWEVKGKVGRIDNPFIVHNTAENLFDYIKKINFYSTLHAGANREEGKTSNVFKIVFYPQAKFWVTLFKSRHIVFSIMQSFHSFLSWSKLYFLRS
jgi:glycosyltransferase involved in cell wall biosynthesis